MSLYGRFDDMVSSVLAPPRRYHSGPLKFIELYCADDYSRVQVEHLCLDTVFSYDIGEDSSTNGSPAVGIPRADRLPEHDLLLAMFSGEDWPQLLNGSLSTREMTPLSRAIRLVRAKRPEGVIFIHGSHLATNQNGLTIEVIKSDLNDLGYSVDHTVRSLFDLGMGPAGEHTIIVATLRRFDTFPWPSMSSARDIVEAVAGIVESRIRPPSRRTAS